MPRRFFLLLLSFAGLTLFLFGCSSGQGNSSQDSTEKATPVRIALADDQTLLASDYQSQTLKLIDGTTLGALSSIAVNGSPLAVGVWQGKLFVGNETSQAVEVFSLADGKKLYDLGDGPGSIPVPNDLAIDAKYQRVFVVDSTNRRIAIFSVNGPLLSTITDTTMVRPIGLVLDEVNELLYVSDIEGAAVLVFTYDGTYVRTIQGAFLRPQGLALDDRNHLFVADPLLGQVQVMNLTTGQEVHRFGNQGTYAGPHTMPLDVVYDPHSQGIYVTDYLTQRIDRFDTAEATP